jgi:hypothetical protein
MKRVAIIAFAAACGSSSPAPVAPSNAGSAVAAATPACTPPTQPGLLGITDITVKGEGKDMMAVKANGDVQVNDGGWKTIGKLDSSGKFVTVDGQTGQLGADGTFSTPEGPAPFKLDGAALVASGQRITIENGKIVGGNDTAKVEIECANDDSTKRTALLILGLLVSAQQSESATPATGTPPSPAPKQ